MIEVKGLTVRAGKHELRNISFGVPAGRYAILKGKTGQGKTTILESLCGLRKIESGTICVDGQDVTDASPGARGIGYVPQDGALFPNLNVREHLAFALRLRKQSKAIIKKRCLELASLLKIAHLLDRSVRNLSGGEAQRVALGRALSFHPKVLLLDEPLSALDEDTRSEMYDLLRMVQKTTGVTTLHVTHSREEAESLGDTHLLLDSSGIHLS
jgi:ABC-type sugar transport system ATPase subunit